jgi:hypothetical protein
VIPPCGYLDELELIAAAPLVTGRYQTWRREHGVPVQVTIGTPKFWGRRPPLEDARVLAPWGLFELEGDEFDRRYRQRLDGIADRVVVTLAAIAAQHPGERLVLCCFEDVWAGQHCHRRTFAAWWEERFGVAVPEVVADARSAPERPQGGQDRLPGL